MVDDLEVAAQMFAKFIMLYHYSLAQAISEAALTGQLPLRFRPCQSLDFSRGDTTAAL